MESKYYTYQESKNFWLTLDNAAKIYPAIISDELTSVFRISAVLTEPVKIKNLLKAVHSIETRFPYYKVQLKKGFFWYYLEHIDQPITVEVDDKTPCRKFPKGKLMFRILVLKNRISTEFSHVLTDGAGAFEFFKSLLVLYFKECGATIPEDFNFLHPTDIVSEEEFEDSYNRYFKENIPAMVKQSKAFHLPYSLNPSPRFDAINVVLSLKEIKDKAAEKSVSITIYLISIYLLILQEIHENLNMLSRYKKNKCLRVEVPVNLRNIYPSRTMRNFSLFVMPQIDLRLGHYTFEEIIKTVHHQIHLEADEKLINKNIARNVGYEKKLFIRGIPLFLKSLILNYKFYSLGTSQYSGVLTNLGMVTFPSEINRHIDYFILTPPPPNKMLKLSCGIIGFNDKLVLSFGNITRSKEFEQKFVKFLAGEGLKSKLTTFTVL
ncbi:hypothetical protein AC481_06655 [miscellaneous Crenarchaeota group archaeon SMTZ-80]|nr:MAG: hypothetical protein AC481_06655 [miscellaneous Crenarchaeota group archaeon SMTZ-80]